MEPEDKGISFEYSEEIRVQTLKFGRFYSIAGIFFVLLITILEYLEHHSGGLVFMRMFFFIPALIFLIVTRLCFAKNTNMKMIIPLYSAVLSGSMLMMCGLALFRFYDSQFSIAYKIATISGGMVTAIFIICIFAAGVGQYLGYILLLPQLCLLVYLGLQNEVRMLELSFFINPLIATFGGLFYTRMQRKLAYREFRMRKLAERRKTVLEQEIQERKDLEKKLQKQAEIDELTGVYNRRVAVNQLEQKMKLARINRQPLTVCFLDLDNLKKVNDRFGHAQGDAMLIKVASLLQSNLRENDDIFRIGGDEFLAILPKCTHRESQLIIERIREEINAETIKNIPLDFSYGLAELDVCAEVTGEELIAKADHNMYLNKFLKAKMVRKKTRKKRILIEENKLF